MQGKYYYYEKYEIINSNRKMLSKYFESGIKDDEDAATKYKEPIIAIVGRELEVRYFDEQQCSTDNNGFDPTKADEICKNALERDGWRFIS